MSSTPTPVTAVPQDTKPIIKEEIVESPEVKPSTIPVIQTNLPNIATVKPTSCSEPMPLNVSIRLPDDMNERKHLIKRNLEGALDMKDVKFNPEAIKYNPEEMKIVPEVKFNPQTEFKQEPQVSNKNSYTYYITIL